MCCNLFVRGFFVIFFRRLEYYYVLEIIRLVFFDNLWFIVIDGSNVVMSYGN